MDRSPSQADAPAPDDAAWLLQYYTPGTPESRAEMCVPPLTPQPLQKYGVEQPLGRGGAKEVVRVHDRDTLRDVALARPRDGSSRLAFVREARILARLEHPNIVPVHDLGRTAEGRPYFTMKLLDGEPLDAVLARLRAGDAETRVRYPLATRLDLFARVCDAVAFAHSRGVIHRDIKPANVQVGAYGEVRLLDWGLAKELAAHAPDHALAADPPNAEADATRSGTVQGTPGYMAPEQAAGRAAAVDLRTDTYALGALLYALLSGRPPITGATTSEILLRTVGGTITPLRPLPPLQTVPRALEAIIRKALATEPAQRYQTADALLADLRAYTAGYATTAEDAGPLTLLTLVVKRHQALALSMAISLLALAALGTFTVIRIRTGERIAVKALAQLQEEQRLRNRLGQAAVPRLMTEARAQIHAQDYDEALSTLRTAIGVDPNRAEAWALTGWIDLGQERYDAAAAAFRHELETLANGKAAFRAPPVRVRRERAGDDPAMALVDLGRKLAGEPPRALVPDAFRQLAAAAFAANAHATRDNRRVMLGAFFARRNPAGATHEAHRALVQWAFRMLNDSHADLDLQPTSTGLVARVSGTDATDLLPLTGLPLASLDLRGTAVRDLQPIRGMPLQTLDLSGTPVATFDPLSGLPLRELTVEGFRKLPANLFALCPALETVIVTPGTELSRQDAVWPASVHVIQR